MPKITLKEYANLLVKQMVITCHLHSDKAGVGELPRLWGKKYRPTLSARLQIEVEKKSSASTKTHDKLDKPRCEQGANSSATQKPTRNCARVRLSLK